MPRQTRVIPDGDRRRLSDGRNAWRKMNEEQRLEFAQWIVRGADAPDISLAVAGALRDAKAIVNRNGGRTHASG